MKCRGRRSTQRHLVVLALALIAGSGCCAAEDTVAYDKAPALSLSIQICVDGLYIMAFDHLRIVEYGAPLVQPGERLYAKITESELLKLRSVIESEEFGEAIARHMATPGPCVCTALRFLRISVNGEFADIELDGREALDESILALLAFVHEVGQRYFAPEYDGRFYAAVSEGSRR